MHWWQSAVIYEVYPRSFQDTNGDGVGDLKGIVERLPYLAEFGVDAIWLSPVFPSPMIDFGYDITDYIGVDPLFGSLADLDALVKAAHAREVKVLLDLVPNHTSDRHPWFAEARASRDNAKREWYIWRDPAPGGGVPNNWLSEFGGSAWQFDEATGQYYYHAFLRSQPDLNWRNPQVSAAIHDVMRFWLKRGVDGFRVDAVWHLIKDSQFRDNPPNPDFKLGTDKPYQRLRARYSTDRPEVHDAIRSMRMVLDEFPERVLISEACMPIEKLAAYYGRDLSGAHLPFNFALIGTPFDPRAIASLIERYEKVLPSGAWPNWVMGNHDRPRLASRIGPENAALAAMLLLTLRGTPTLYYGDEIGMTQAPIPPERRRDPAAADVPGRDSARTPMQWNASAYSGFSTAEPWLPLEKDFARHNVAGERKDPGSLLNLYRRLIAARRITPALVQGSYRSIAVMGDVLTYVRELTGDRVRVALNFGARPATISLPGQGSAILVSTDRGRDGESIDRSLTLGPHQGAVVALAA